MDERQQFLQLIDQDSLNLSAENIQTAVHVAACILGVIQTVTLQQKPQDDPKPKECKGECEGSAGVELLVDAGNCDAVDEDVKDQILKKACEIAKLREAYWKKIAKNRANGDCKERSGDRECRCEEGTYEMYSYIQTYLFSGKCWAYCGWTYKGKCKKKAKEKEDSKLPEKKDK